jgi:lysozyme
VSKYKVRVYKDDQVINEYEIPKDETPEPEPEPEGETYQVLPYALKVRMKPDRDSEEMGIIYAGDKIKAIEIDNEEENEYLWVKIVSGNYKDKFCASGTLDGTGVYLKKINQKPLGLDISHWNGYPINWVKAKEQGISFAWIKATEGISLVDEWFSSNVTAAKLEGIHVGAYHYFRNDIDPVKQAEFFWSIAHSLRLAVDVEDPNNITDDTPYRLLEFVTELEKLSGQSVVIYTRAEYWDTHINMLYMLYLNDLWIAYVYSDADYDVNHPTLPDDWSSWRFWQYTDKGNGTKYGVGSQWVDLNQFNGSFDELKAYFTVTDEKPKTIVQAGLAPIVGKTTEGITWKSFLVGNDSRARMGACIRDIVHALVRWPNNHITNELIEKQLLRCNHRSGIPPFAPSWEPINCAYIRVAAPFHTKTTKENIAACRRFMDMVREYTWNNIPLMRVLFVLNDSLGHSQMTINGEQEYHTGSYGHFNPEYYKTGYKKHFPQFVADVIPAIVEGNEKYIFGFNAINEPVLEVGNRTASNAGYYLDCIRDMSERIFIAGNRQYPLGIGCANTWQTCPSESGVTAQTWANEVYNTASTPFIHWASLHIYQNPPIPNATPKVPSDLWYEENCARIDALSANRPYIIEEYGTYYQQPIGIQRHEASQAFLTRWMLGTNADKLKAYAAFGWAMQDGDDIGLGDKYLGEFDSASDPRGAPNMWNVAYQFANYILWNLG